MEKRLQTINIIHLNKQGEEINIPLSYEHFGPPLGDAPIVLVNHALTGNSTVSGDNGWWKDIIGDDKIISSKKYSILSFNIPGNGYNHFYIDDYQNYTAKDIASIFNKGLEQLSISQLHSIIGGSLGGSLGWEMLTEKPNLAQYFIPIAADHKTHDWLFAQCQIQKLLLESPEKPLQKARYHAMLCYRTPQSLNERFNNVIIEDLQIRSSQDWLNYHSNSLNERFSLKAYKLMNQLLLTINTRFQDLEKIKAQILLIAIDSDLLFPAFEIKKTYNKLKKYKDNVFYDEISSIHGHDAFLMEYRQLATILKPIYN